MMNIATGLLIAASIGSNDTSAPKCYVLLFGGQAINFRPYTAHTWATFVRGTPESFETFTISWLPVEMPGRPFRLIPIEGRNYSLHETVAIYKKTGRHELSVWGPFEIKPSWYEEAFAHKQYLDSGAVKHITFDRGPLFPGGKVRRPDLSHCVHAITRTNEALRQSSNPIFGYGELVTRKVADRMDSVGLLINPSQTHDWVITALNLDPNAPVSRRKLGEPAIKFLR